MRRILPAFLCALGLFFSAQLHAELRYIFYFIGDGMGMGHLLTTEMYNQTANPEGRQLMMTKFPVAGQVKTSSASSPVTDSAAAGTALATGTKTRNGMIGVAPDTTALKSLAMQLMEDGFGIGLVTSNSPDDATPASFYAHSASRSAYYDIDCQAATSSVDFLGGANLRGLKDKEHNLTDLPERFARTNTAIAYGLDELAQVKQPKVVLLNHNRELKNTLGYAIDSLENTLSLTQMTAACMQWLESHHPESFFMMVECGILDWAAHGNDAATVIHEVNRLDEAVEMAVAFYLQHPDETLIVVTADHDTGGMTLGNPTLKYQAHLEYLALQRVSKDAFSDAVKAMLRSRRAYRWEDMEEMLRRDFGFWDKVPVSENETAELKEMFEKMFSGQETENQKTLYAYYNSFAVKVLSIMNDHAGVGWISLDHTGNLVPVFAMGVGAERFGRFNDNTDIPKTILDIVDKSITRPKIIK